jgi:hypothetical protein
MDGVPFEFLDPCCQKDVLEQERNKKLKARLATTDPSLKKERQIESVFSGVFKSPTCHTCCSGPSDYALLAQLREEVAWEDEQGQRGGGDDEADDGEGGDSDESDIDLDDGFESAYEIELKAKLLERTLVMREKEKLMLGIHIEDSVAHTMSYINQAAKIIVHIYDPSSLLCAKLDISLENAAKRYSATRFRRVPMFDAAEMCQKYSLPPHTPVLVCFAEKCVSSFTTDFLELIPDGEINSNDFFRFLDNSKVAIDKDLDGDATLSMSMNAALLAGKALQNDNDSGSDEDSKKFCDSVGCAKKYAHTHIGEGGGNPFSSGGGAGSEALGKDYFTKL